jgi:hypothetical protein
LDNYHYSIQRRKDFNMVCWKNRDRDYVVSMLPLAASHHSGTVFSLDTASLARMHGTAQSRVVNFWGGDWKRFLVRGPMKLAIRVAENYSINTILQAAMLDPLSQHPAPYYFGHRAWQERETQRREFRNQLVAACATGKLFDDPPGGKTGGVGLALTRRILHVMNLLEHRDPAVWAANQRFAYLSILRWCMARCGSIPKYSEAAQIAEKSYFHLDLFRRWEAAERSRGILTSRAIEKGLRWGRMHFYYRGLEAVTIRNFVKGLKGSRRKMAAN